MAGELVTTAEAVFAACRRRNVRAVAVVDDAVGVIHLHKDAIAHMMARGHLLTEASPWVLSFPSGATLWVVCAESDVGQLAGHTFDVAFIGPEVGDAWAAEVARRTGGGRG